MNIKWNDLIKGNKTYQSRVKEWVKAHDCLAGQARIKSKKTKYLPASGTVMKQQEWTMASVRGGHRYESYLQGASFVNFTKGTHASYVGSLTRLPAEVEGIDKSPLQEFVNNIDMNEMSIQEGITQTIEEHLTTGRAGIMIEFPTKEEDKQGARSYPVPLQAHNVLDHHKELRNGKLVYVFIKLKFVQTVLNKEGTGYEEQDAVVILTLDKENKYHYAKYSKDPADTDGNGAPVEVWKGYPTSNNVKLTEIPVRLTGDGKTSLIAGVVDQNLSHYVAWANLKRLLSKKGQGVTVATYPVDERISKTARINLEAAMETGFEDTEHVLPQGSGIKYEEFKGTGATRLRQDVQDHADIIGKLGAFHLTDNIGGVESDATLRIKNSGQMSGLSMTGHAVGEVWEWALNFLLKHWQTGSKEVKEVITVGINRDYLPIDISANVLKEIRESFGAGGIIMYNYMKAADRLPKSLDSYEDFEKDFNKSKGEEPAQEAPEVPEDPILPTKEEVDDETPKDKDK